MTQDRLVELVRDQIEQYHPGGVTLAVVPEDVRQRDGIWYVPVLPSVQPPKMYEYYEVLAEVADTLEENEQIQIWLVPIIPEEEPTAATTDQAAR